MESSLAVELAMVELKQQKMKSDANSSSTPDQTRASFLDYYTLFLWKNQFKSRPGLWVRRNYPLVSMTKDACGSDWIIHQKLQDRPFWTVTCLDEFP